MTPSGGPDSFDRLWAELEPVGRDPGTGGYRRYAWTPADLTLREWFVGAAEARGLDVETDRNGNLWAWWGAPGPGATVFGSHLDSVPDGGAFDGPLGVVSAFAALDALQAAGVTPTRPVALAVFTDEEGARFGLPCLGSRLATGASTPDDVLGRRDRDGTTLAEALRAVGRDPGTLGPDPETLGRIGCFVELHVEQGRALDVPVGAASAIIPHGRWRLEFTGRADHAGTTRLVDRRDPMLPYASTVLAARAAAETHDAVATLGRIESLPGATNAVPSSVRAWLDARAEAETSVDAVLAEVTRAAQEAGSLHGVTVEVAQESRSPAVEFPRAVLDWFAGELGELPVVPTGAGHDAGVLAGVVPSGMLFVRNPTGISHSPKEHAERADCLAGVDALATLMRSAAS
ncbi:allantoate amidohydrolase [Jatrophihabitans sp. YIM 134969]